MDNLAKEFEGVFAQEFNVMPNHIHGIIEIRNDDIIQSRVGAYPCDRPCMSRSGPDEHKVHPYGTKNGSLGRIVQAYKSRTTGEYIKMVKNKLCRPFSGKIWQKNYYEIIISNEKQYNNIVGYILNNPIQWLKGEDEYG